MRSRREYGDLMESIAGSYHARLVRDNRGKVVTWYGTNADIEDRRRAEEELRRSESQGCEPVATCS